MKPDKQSAATTPWFPSGSVRGLGIAPIGVTATLKPDGTFSPFVGLSGGTLYFEEPIPTTGASRFNFTASFELGLRFSPAKLPSFALEYRFLHISNAGAAENLGVASHLLTLAVSRGRSKRA